MSVLKRVFSFVISLPGRDKLTNLRRSRFMKASHCAFAPVEKIRRSMTMQFQHHCAPVHQTSLHWSIRRRTRETETHISHFPAAAMQWTRENALHSGKLRQIYQSKSSCTGAVEQPPFQNFPSMAMSCKERQCDSENSGQR